MFQSIFKRGAVALAVGLACQGVCLAGNAAAPAGEPVVEPATLKCLGAYWVIKGDDNKNAEVRVAYRKVGTQDWIAGPPLFRVAKGANMDRDIKLTPEDWLFAGSIIDVPEATDYEIKLSLIDPDGGAAEKIVKAHTIAEPVDPVGGPTYHVVAGNGGGTGTEKDPFKGMAAADAAAKPGDTFLVHAGKYIGQFTVTKSGEEGKPIVYKGAGDGDAIFETNEGPEKGHVIWVQAKHDVWFEHLTVQGPSYSDFTLHDSYRIVIRRCHILPQLQGIYATQNTTSKMGQFFISDNVIDGSQPWPATAEQWGTPKGNPNVIKENRGIWIGGSGNVVCYNRVHNTKDGIDTAEYGQETKKPGSPTADQFQAEVAVDFHNNEVFNCYDDGSEMDGSYRNCRNFYNRYTNTLTGLSFQPVLGGPIYAYRNVLYNVKSEFLKLHSDPSGAFVVQNTFIHKGPLLYVSAKAKVENCYSRNNLYIGTEGRALDFDLTTKDMDFDYDGFGGASAVKDVFLRYNTDKANRFATVEDVRKNSDLEKHLVIVDSATLFLNGLKPPEFGPDYKEDAPGRTWTTGLRIYKSEDIDARLKPGSAAVGAAETLPGFNDGSKGTPADLGAYPVGAAVYQYGPRPEKK